jgi:hypothetical protein
MNTLEHIRPNSHQPENDEPKNFNIPESQETSKTRERMPFLLAGVALQEGHAFGPTSSNPGAPTTFTGMKIDDGQGSSD